MLYFEVKILISNNCTLILHTKLFLHIKLEVLDSHGSARTFFYGIRILIVLLIKNSNNIFDSKFLLLFLISLKYFTRYRLIL